MIHSSVTLWQHDSVGNDGALRSPVDTVPNRAERHGGRSLQDSAAKVFTCFELCPILPDLALPPLTICVTPYGLQSLVLPVVSTSFSKAIQVL